MPTSASSRRSAGFAPVAGADARVLILGSLPSQRSIAAREYYAHPRNAFWKIMAALTGAKGDYTERCAMLMRKKIALWDVLSGAVRPGSLDADIQTATVAVNDFRSFLASHGTIERICFNGQKAEKLFAQKAQTSLGNRDVRLLTLPSTSPAYAAMIFDEKLEHWRSGINGTFSSRCGRNRE